MKSRARPALVVGTVLVVAALSSAERCGPAVGLWPAYAPQGAVADDGLVGDFIVVEGISAKDEKTGRAVIKREDTADGPSYLLTFPTSTEPAMKDVRMRMFVVDVGGKKFADLVAEGTSKASSFARDMTTPLHVYFRVTHTAADGVALEYLDAKWFDAALEKDPKLVATLALPKDYSKRGDGPPAAARETAIAGDTAAVQALLSKASSVDEAWTNGLELVRKGAPALSLVVTSARDEASRDSSHSGDKIELKGTKLTFTSEESGAHAAPNTTAYGRVQDTKKIDDLVKAFAKTPASKAKPVPKIKTDITTTSACVTVGSAKPRCIERMSGDDGGADLAAFNALRTALMADVKITAVPVAPR